MEKENTVTGEIAIITGNSRGIGRSIKGKLREYGVIVPDISTTDGYDLVENGIEKLIEVFPTTDILINNVGGGGRWGEDIDPWEFDEWDKIYEKNAGIARKLTTHYLPGMIAQGWGRIITIASIYGTESGGLPWFTIAKASQIALNKELARKCYPGITINTISPGPVKDAGKRIDEGIESIDIANLALFLCSDLAKNISGQNIVIDKGKYTRSF